MGKKSGGGNQTTTVNPPEFLRPALEGAIGKAENLYSQGPQEFYPGQTFAGFNPLQIQGQQEQLNFAQGVLPGLNQQLYGGFGQALNTDVTQDPSVQAALQSIENRAGRLFSNQILPGIESQAIGAGGLGGSRQGVAEGLAAQGLLENVADAQGSFLGNQLDSARRAQGAAMAIAPQIAQQGLLGGNIMGQIGSQWQGLDQAAINEAMQRFQFEQQAPTNQLDTLINQLTGLGGGFSQQNTYAKGQSNPLGGALGGALLANTLPASLVGSGSFGTIGGAFGPLGLAGGALLGALLS